MDMYLPGLPSMARDLSAPAWAAQLTITTSMLGLASGQLVAGPISDALGRRRPLLAGVGAYMVGLAAVRRRSDHLAAARLPPRPGPGGRGRDRHRARDRARPARGGRGRALLRPAHARRRPRADPRSAGRRRAAARDRLARDLRRARGHRRGAAASRRGRRSRETLAPANRHGGGLVATLHVFRGLVRDRPFMGYTLSAGLVFAAMATYISGSPFVLQDIHGVSPQLFSVIFASNAIGIMAASQVSRALVGRYGPRAMLGAGVWIAAAGGLGVLVSVRGRPRARRPAPQPLRDGLERRRGAAQRGRARPGRPPAHRRQRVGAARRHAVRHRRAGRPAGRRRRLADRAADGDRHGHAAPRRPRRA